MIIELKSIPLLMPSTAEAHRPVDSLRLEIEQAITMRPDFVQFDKTDIPHKSILLARYKVDSMEELRNAKNRNRDFATDDLRRNLDIDYAHYKMLLGLFDPFPPLLRNRCYAGFIEEIPIPRNLSSYKIDFLGPMVLYAPIEIQSMRFQNKSRLLNRTLCRFIRIFVSIWP